MKMKNLFAVAVSIRVGVLCCASCCCVAELSELAEALPAEVWQACSSCARSPSN
jgi:hypothetical protein